MSKTPKARRLAGALTPFRVSMTPMGPVRLSLGRTRERLFLSALLDALTTGVERALASSLGGQLLASLLVGALLLEVGHVVLVEVLLGLLGLLQGLDLAAFSVSATHFDVCRVKESMELC
jgi:hypothetical protein